MALSESQLQEEVEEVGVPDTTDTSAPRTWEHHGKGLLRCHCFQERVDAKLGTSAALQDFLLMLFHQQIWARRGAETDAGDSNP